MSMSRIFLFVTMNLLFSLSTSTLLLSGESQRSILRVIEDESKNNNNKPQIDYVIDLNATSFDDIFRDASVSFAIVEFFAHWFVKCPACRNYKPHYEKVARLFNGPDAVHPGILLMTRVDCASKINTKLCDRFSVSHYPMLFWGPPSKFVSAGWDPNNDKSDIRVVDDPRPAENLLTWINKQLGSSYGLIDQKFDNEHLSSNISDPGQIARAMYDVEEATAVAFEIIFAHKMIKSETRASLVQFLQLIVAHHPSRRCRKGSAEVLFNFDDLYPQDMWPSLKQEVVDNGKSALANIPICGKEVPLGYWTFCRGSKNDTRGFSCGLWILLHSLSVRIEDGESEFVFTAICEFIHNFFICEECRQYFYKTCSKVGTPFNKSRELALWLWSTHNKVNERLMKEEAALETGDPKFPKIIWPPKQLCSSCYRSHSRAEDGNGQIDWNLDEVYKLLINYYGTTLASLYKDKEPIQSEVSNPIDDLVTQTSAVVVPMGAAAAIALASCAFGALAYYWRSYQKSQKYYHHVHSLKNI